MAIDFNQYFPNVGSLNTATYFTLHAGDSSYVAIENIDGRSVLRLRSTSADVVGSLGDLRTEITQQGPFVWPNGSDEWIRWAIMVPYQDITNTSFRTISQLHASPQAGGGSPPPFFWVLRGDNIFLCRNNEIVTDTTWRRSEQLARWYVDWGKWHEFVVRVNVSKTDGRLQVWHNDVLSIDLANAPTLFNANSNLYWKAGIYPPNGYTDTCTIYSDGMTSGSGYTDKASFLTATGLGTIPMKRAGKRHRQVPRSFMRFSGGRVEVPDNAAYSFGTSPVLIACWIRPASVINSGGSFQYQVLFSDNDTTHELALKNYGFVNTGGTDFESFLRVQPKNNAAGTNIVHTSEYVMQRNHLGGWVHVAALTTPSDGATKFWIDGCQYVASATRDYGNDYVDTKASFTFATSSNTFVLGSRHTNGTLPFLGDMSRMQVWVGFTPTNSDIQDIMNGNPPRTNLVGEWMVTTPSGATVTDSSTTANNGTIQGAAAWYAYTDPGLRTDTLATRTIAARPIHEQI